MFSRHVFLPLSALVAAILLAVGNPTAKAAAPDLCFGGNASGTWNLPPTPAQLGHADGTLMFDESDVAYALLDAFLTEEPRRPKIRFGRIFGFLTDPTDPATPFALVTGTWRGPAGGISGGFRATIYDLGTGTFTGSMAGTYHLPLSGSGNFLATWSVCTVP